MSVSRERAIAVGVGAAVGGLFAVLHGASSSTFGQGALAIGAGLSFVEMRRLRELGKRDHRAHGRATAWWHFTTTNLLAVAYAWFMFDGYAIGGDAAFKAFGNAAKDWMLAAGLVGGNIGLFRSTGTNSASLAALRQNEQLRAEVVAVRRQLGNATDLTTMALDASQSESLDEVLDLVGRMVTAASDLPEKSDLVDAFTVWIADPVKKSWRILSGRGISAESLAHFTQPMLDAPKDGAGMIANMAVTRTSHVVVGSGAHRHPWHSADPDSQRNTEGFAAALVFARTGEPCGAICLTSQDLAALPSAESHSDLRRFEKVLLLWSGTFSLPLQRTFDLLDRPASAPAVPLS